MIENSNSVIECHRFYVERGEDGLLISQCWIIVRGNLRRDVTITHRDLGPGTRLVTLADRMTHMSHRFTLTALRSALLSGDPCNHSINQDTAALRQSQCICIVYNINMQDSVIAEEPGSSYLH